MKTRSQRVVFALLVALAACGGDDSSLVNAPDPAPKAHAPRAAIEVRVEAGKVWLRCDDALRSLVLGRLGEEAGFALVVEQGPAGRVTLDLRDVPLGEALLVLLRDVPFAVEYAGEASGGHRVAQVRVGSPEPVPAGQAPPAPAHGADRATSRSSAAATLEELDDRELELHLTSRDPRERADAVADLTTDGPQLAWLLFLATDDPDPGVRMAALEELEGEGGYAALRTLIRALDDADPAVVVRALQAIAYLGDPTLRPELAFLAEHRDAGVRAALAETLEELEP